MLQYVRFYCGQDVELLRLGLHKFRETYLEKYNVDCLNYLSLPSLG